MSGIRRNLPGIRGLRPVLPQKLTNTMRNNAFLRPALRLAGPGLVVPDAQPQPMAQPMAPAVQPLGELAAAGPQMMGQGGGMGTDMGGDQMFGAPPWMGYRRGVIRQMNDN